MSNPVENTDTNTTYPTIQAAVDHADPGETIVVDDGSYDEIVTVDVADLALEGPNAGTSGDSSRGNEAIVGTTDGAFILESDGIAIDGFELSGANAAYSNNDRGAITTSGNASGYTIKNNVIEDNDLGILLRNDGNDESDAVVVENNLLRNNDQATDGRARGIGTGWWDPNIDQLNYATIRNNSFEGHVEGGNSYAIQLAAGQGDHTEVTVENNSFQGTVLVNQVEGYDHRSNTHDMSADTDSSSILFFGGDVNDAEITENTFSNAEVRAIGITEVFGGPNQHIAIEENTFEDNPTGISIYGGVANISSMSATHNTFENNDDAIDNQSGEEFRAEENWWGDASGPSGAGPGNGDPVSQDVDYSPWLRTAVGSDPMTFGVDTTATIQAAIDIATTGDTVVVNGGDYDDGSTLEIDVEGLTLGGPNHGTPADQARATEATISGSIEVTESEASIDGFTVETGPANAIVVKSGADEATVANNVIAGSGDPNDTHVGVTIEDNDATVEANVIGGFATGIALNGHTATIAGNTIPDNGTTLGISVTTGNNAFSGNEITGADDGIDVSGNGNALDGNTLQQISGFGIQVAGDNAEALTNTLETIGGPGINVTGNSGRIDGNDIGDIDGSGIQLTGDSLEVNDNTIEDANGGISLSGTNSEILENEVSGASLSTGISIDGNANAVKENTIEEATDGVSVDGNDNNLHDNEIGTDSDTSIELLDGATGNDIRGNTVETGAGGHSVLIQNIGSGNHIVLNDLQGGATAIRVASGGNPEGVVVHLNDLVESDAGVIIEDAPNDAILDARSNFWDHNSGPSSELDVPNRSVDPETGLVADGEGVTVSRDVRFDEWIEVSNAFIIDTARDLDGDGRHEDIDEDGTHWPTDGHYFLRHYREGHFDLLSDVASGYIDRFDYDGDGEVTREDIARMVLKPHL